MLLPFVLGIVRLSSSWYYQDRYSRKKEVNGRINQWALLRVKVGLYCMMGGLINKTTTIKPNPTTTGRTWYLLVVRDKKNTRDKEKITSAFALITQPQSYGRTPSSSWDTFFSSRWSSTTPQAPEALIYKISKIFTSSLEIFRKRACYNKHQHPKPTELLVYIWK